MTDFVNHILCLGIGLSLEDIFCTSIEDMTMRNGEDIRRTIESLNLTPNAKELKKFTEEDYSQVATKDYVDKSTMSEN